MVDSLKQRFFTSYARKDERIVRQILKLVTISGAFAFFDQDHISPGSDWRITLATAIGESDAIIVFWSRNASESAWVRREWKLGLRLGKRIIPVRLDGVPMPKELSRLQAIDLRVTIPCEGVVHKSIFYSLLREWDPGELERLLCLSANKLTAGLAALFEKSN